ncbi:MAG: DedA family protein [Candidatus Nitrohelix vancouverensis]|uniref:DedA family protein n=1 Tax=Candidatus Nitrohelix vancouverensis TaxID=2705534 RepID=A0A7T0G256_9BACT|nr:MAG: DedA family protein [Candidatus Nitrohelix vancouverensis]
MKPLRNLYDWVLRWSSTPYALPALAVISFVESSFFPIPPDVLLIAMVAAVPSGWVRYALVCSVASVLGGMFGYLIGFSFMELIGNQIVQFYHFQEKFDKIAGLFQQYEAWAVAAAGFTPLPYKVFTIAAGAFEINFPIFVLASAFSRSARFFLVAYLLYKFGPAIRALIEKYFNIFSIVFFVLLFLGFYLLKFVL